MISSRHPEYQPGDWVIYRKTKHSDHPGPRAQKILPASHGDEYTYLVDKFWVVTDVSDDGQIAIRTRRGKQHRVDADDFNLRKASLWERLWYRNRFESVESNPSESVDAT